MKIRVKLTNGDYIEKVSPKTSMILGRSQKCDFVIPDDSLSRNHCQIDFEDGDFFITDLGSSNGVQIDGKRIPPNVRKAFTTFQDVQLGLLELTITDTDEGRAIPSPTPRVQPSNSNNRSGDIRKPSTTHKTTLIKNPIRNDKSNRPKIYVLIFLIVMGGVFYKFYYDQTPEVESVKTTIEANIPEGTSTPDAFLNLEQYQVKDATKTCNELCKEFGLEADNQEGILHENNEYFIFVRPRANKMEPLFSKIANLENGLDIPILYKTLNSPIFQSFREKKTIQIHVIFKDQNYQISKIYRFHTKYFSTMGPEQIELLGELEAAFESGDLNGFWNRSKPIMQIHTF